MKKLLLSALLSSMITTAQCDEHSINHYIGVDVKLRYMPFTKNFGSHVFRQNYPEGNFFFGLKFNDYIGIEVGYSSTTQHKKNGLIIGPSTLLGLPLFAGETEIFTTSVQTNNVNASIMGFIPLSNNLQLLGGIGISRMHLKLSYQPIGNENGQLSPNEVQMRTRDFSKNKYIAQTKVGIQYMLTDNISIRALIGWENTQKFKLLSPKQPSALKTSLKNSSTYSVGLVWHF